ncbi:MAG TPA: 3-hydroxyacyl-CoA dehydrogenase family protein [Solirubrobacteraceae bacterium]|nr:3-hydroxyacyl-CoA dehydrogenase family protein [Solirubrobacteraceae bacterium]
MQERLGIAGAGAIACGLAATAARAGEVVLWARSDGSARRARDRVAKTLSRIDDGVIDPDRVQVVTDLAALAAATFLVEAVVEDHGHKAALLSDLAGHAAPAAVLATTTSSLSIAQLALAAGRPERFVGLHVFNPVPRMKLIELVFPETASEDTRERAVALCLALEKTAVEVPDIPGFVVNRLLFPYLFSAVELMAETGLTPEAVDSCMTLGAGQPMGPIALLDFVGLDVSQAIGEAIGASVPESLRALVEEGSLGRKSGQGFYSYE